MKAITRMELSRAFKNKYFYFAITVGIGITLWHYFRYSYVLAEDIYKVYKGTMFSTFFEKVTYGTPVVEAWIGTRNIGSNIYFFILPLLCAIPYGISSYLDKKSGYINNITTRVDKKKYYKAKLLAVFLSGGAVAVIPLIFNLLLCMCTLPVMFPLASSKLFPVSIASIFGDLFYSHTFLYIFIYLLFDFIFFGLLNCLCIVMTYFEDNRFAVVLSPFIIYFAVHVFCSWGLGKGGYSPMVYTFFPQFHTQNVGIISAQILILLVLALLTIRGSKHDTI